MLGCFFLYKGPQFGAEVSGRRGAHKMHNYANENSDDTDDEEDDEWCISMQMHLWKRFSNWWRRRRTLWIESKPIANQMLICTIFVDLRPLHSGSIFIKKWLKPSFRDQLGQFFEMVLFYKFIKQENLALTHLLLESINSFPMPNHCNALSWLVSPSLTQSGYFMLMFAQDLSKQSAMVICLHAGSPLGQKTSLTGC